jgi:hypothetical protein
MPRTVPDPEVHLELARRTLTGWEAIGMPGGSARDNLRMIHQELQRLAEIRKAFPSTAKVVDDFGARFGAIANKIRLGQN